MRTIFVRSLALAAVALTVTSAAVGEERASRLLNNMEVRQLAARAEPADHVRLSAHFNALGDWYTAAANRHRSMSEHFIGNASRNLASPMSMHCKRLAELRTQSATTARQLAEYHGKLSSGATGTPPDGAARFHNGAGAPEPTDKERDALTAKARTPAEHRALYEYFLTLANRYTADAKEHVALAQVYRGTRLAQVALHHDRLASFARESAKEATAAAVMHKDLAHIAR